MSVKGVIYMKVKKGSKILVYGDSITDAGRSFQDRNDLGKGYCLLRKPWRERRPSSIGASAATVPSIY